MQNINSPTPRWPRRVLAAAAGCLFSAIVVAIQIPAVRETIGTAKTVYRFIDSTVPTLGVAGVWIGFVLLVVGAIGAWWLHRLLKEGAAKTVAVGSTVLVIAVGGLVAVVSTLNQSPPIKSYEAKVTKHHRHHRRGAGHQPSRSSSSASPHSTPTQPPAPAPASTPSPVPVPPAPGGSSSSSGGSGGNNNRITVEETNNQNVKSGDAKGTNATSGGAKAENNKPVSISIG